jgi:hypothetical protein
MMCLSRAEATMLTMNRPCLFSALALAVRVATSETGSMAFAQAYPSRTIRLPSSTLYNFEWLFPDSRELGDQEFDQRPQ